MRNHTYRIKAVWNDETRVWVATSNDVLGLVNEVSTMDTLLKNLRS